MVDLNEPKKEIPESSLAKVAYLKEMFVVSHVNIENNQSYSGGHPATNLNDQILRITIQDFPGNVWNLFIPEGLYWYGLIDESKGMDHFVNPVEREWKVEME